MKLTGNIIPAAWYETILCAGGKEPRKREAKPDRVTIDVLSEIVFWYRPSYIRDGKHGKWKKRFKADLLQLDRGTLANKFKVSKRQISRSLEKLEELGVVRRVLRTIQKGTGGAELRNVLYIELVPAGLAKVSRVELPSGATRVDTGVNTSGRARQHIRTQASPRVDAEVKTNTESTTQNTTISSSSGAKRPHSGDENNSSNNSGCAVPGAAAPSPAAAPAGLPSAQSGLPPRTPHDDPEIERAKRKADKLIRYLSQAHQNLRRKEYSGLPVLGDRMNKARSRIEDYLQLNPEFKVGCILEVILTCWMYDLSNEHWFAKKLGGSPNLLWMRLGSGEHQKDETVLEGAARELEIDLFQSGSSTREAFTEGGILESWEAEGTRKQAQQNNTNG